MHATVSGSGVNTENFYPLSRSNQKESIWEKIVDKGALRPSTIMLAIMFANSIGTFLVVHAVNKGISNLGVLADYAGLGSIFLTAAMLTFIIFFGYLLLDRKRYFHASSLQEAK